MCNRISKYVLMIFPYFQWNVLCRARISIMYSFLSDAQTASIMWGFLRNHISEIDKLQISWKYKLHLPCTIFATTYLYTTWFISLLVIRTLQYSYIAQNLYNGIPPQLQIINTLYIYLRIPSIIQSRCSRCGTHKFK